MSRESLLWRSGLRIPLEQLGSLQRLRFDPRPGAVGERIQCSPYAAGAVIEKKKKSDVSSGS